MLYFMGKEFRLAIRIQPVLKRKIDAAADYYGLTTSSYVHSVLVRHIRKEEEEIPEVFAQLDKELLAEMKSAATRPAKKLGDVGEATGKRKAA
jgi:antitoxin component of RelBE/YafQ-DinJ toxin-antitoxin module